MLRIIEPTGGVRRVQRGVVLALLVAVAVASCSVRLPAEVVEDLTPPDGRRPNNYDLRPGVEKRAEK